MTSLRIERDLLGEKKIKIDMLWGIHSLRAKENFYLSDKKIPSSLISAYGQVKLACLITNRKLGYIEIDKAKIIQNACQEMIDGKLDEHIIVHPMQGGAGTSTNLNVCEVIANRSLQLMGKQPGQYAYCDPIEIVNMHQSTNDTYATALRLAAFKQLNRLEQSITQLHQIIEKHEQTFSQILKLGRTELMDALPMTMGRSFGAWAEALSRDRWRVFKATERLRVVNLGGTAIGTGLGAPQDYIFSVTDELRQLTGLPLARSENLVDATQNQDVLIEVMGMLKAHAMNVMKISGDLRLLSMNSISELVLPAIQTGSSIMTGKINPVIPEMLTQVALQVAASDQALGMAVGLGQLELNAFMPFIAMHLLESLELLINANNLAATKCFQAIKVNQKNAKEQVLASPTIATALIPLVGYHQAGQIAELMKNEHCTLEAAVNKFAGINWEACQRWLTPEAINALGFKKITDKENDD